jgi:hypothetical protein
VKDDSWTGQLQSALGAAAFSVAGLAFMAIM